MKKIFFALSFLTVASVSAQKKKANILESTNIPEIENFLKTSHPDDPRRIVLKSKLIALKNSSWTKSGKTPYATAKPVILEIPKSIVKQKNNEEAEEFKRLITESSTAHKEKTVKLLNMIVRIQGRNFYNLAVPSHGENSVVIKKGEYQLVSNVCDAKYSSTKSIGKNMLIILNNPVVNAPAKNVAQINGVSN